MSKKIVPNDTPDFIGMDEAVYHFETTEKNLGLPFGDEVYKIVLNTKCSPEKFPEKLKPMYDYINNPENEIKDDFIKKVDVEVRKYNNDEWRWTGQKETKPCPLRKETLIVRHLIFISVFLGIFIEKLS